LREVFDVVLLPWPWVLFVIFWIIVNVIVVEFAKWIANTFITKTMDKTAGKK